MNPTLRQSCWILTLSVVAISMVFLKFVWWPNHRAIKEMNHQIEAERTVVAQGTGLSTSLANAKQELDSAQSVARRWEKAAPGKRDIPALFARIDALAKNANLTIGRFDPQPAVPHESFEEIPINMTCSGTFAQIYEFLRAVEGMPVTVWVESLRMEKTGKAVKGVKCELNLVVFSDNS